MDIDGVPYIDQIGQAAWVAEHTDLPLDVVASVLHIEFELMMGMGLITSDPPGIEYEFDYYEPGDLDDVRGTSTVDCCRIARDAERFIGVDPELAHRILGSEVDYLQIRGLA